MRAAAAAILAILSALPARADAVLDRVFLHVVAHEIGHAAIREFDLPVTASEEAMADAFAVVLLHTGFPDDAGAIVADRAAAHLAEDDRPGIFDEHPPDARRAGAMLCLALALDPEGRAEMAASFGLEGEDADACVDAGTEVGRGWRRLMAPYRLPEVAAVTEAGVRLARGRLPEGSPSDAAVGRARAMLTAIDWHSFVTLSLDAGCDGAGWSRNGRVISVCDAYLALLAVAARSAPGR